MRQIIGKITSNVIEILKIDTPTDSNIYIGESNIIHMKKRHPNDYAKYGQYLSTILSAPDYVGINTSDDSIEYVKEFVVNGDYVKVAVRATETNKKYYVKTMYVLNPKRTQNFIAKGTLKKVNR